MVNDNIVEFCSKAAQFSGIKRVGVFGSHARGEQNFDSDIDILYDYHYIDNTDNGLDDAHEFLDILENDLKKHLGVVKVDFISYSQITDIHEPDAYDIAFRDNILRDVIWLYDVTV